MNASPLRRPQDTRCEVVFNQPCGNNLYLLRFRVLEGSGGEAHMVCAPGQFVMVDLPEERFLFRRPFSVLGMVDARTFDLYYKVVGMGTEMMRRWEPGQITRVLGPLGNRFTPPQAPDTALYVGGGIGIAPLLFLAREAGSPGRCVYGVRSAGDVGLESLLTESFGGQWQLATDDGSAGFHGNVCGLLQERPNWVTQAREAYVCGPTAMMAATADLLHRLNPALNIQVSLEEHMPCGTGACTGCVVPRRDQPLPSKVCLEGPVFAASAILWPGRERDDLKHAGVPACPS